MSTIIYDYLRDATLVLDLPSFDFSALVLAGTWIKSDIRHSARISTDHE